MGEGLSGIQIEGEDMRGENVEEEGGEGELYVWIYNFSIIPKLILK